MQRHRTPPPYVPPRRRLLAHVQLACNQASDLHRAVARLVGPVERAEDESAAEVFREIHAYRARLVEHLAELEGLFEDVRCGRVVRPWGDA